VESGLVGFPEQFPRVSSDGVRPRRSASCAEFSHSFERPGARQSVAPEASARSRALLDCRRNRRALTASSLKRRRGRRTCCLSAPLVSAVYRTSRARRQQTREGRSPWLGRSKEPLDADVENPLARLELPPRWCHATVPTCRASRTASESCGDSRTPPGSVAGSRTARWDRTGEEPLQSVST